MSTDNITAELCIINSVVVGSDGDLLSGLWYVGVILSIVSSIASNLGVNVQKLSMIKEFKKAEVDPDYTPKAYIFQKIWVFGLVLVILGSVGDFAALGFAAQSLAAPVGGVTMVANVVFSSLLLHEKMYKRDYIATFIVLIGVVTVAISADKTEKTYTLQCLLLLYQRPIFIYYIVIIALVVIALYVAVRRLEAMRNENPNSPKYLKYRRLHAICPPALSGVIGAQSVLFAKCSAELIKNTFEGDNQFIYWQTWIIILLMLFTIFNQLHWLAQGLKHFDAVTVIPIFQCFFITGGVVGGGIFFEEFANLATWEMIMFTLGVVTTIVGVIILSQREGDKDAVHPEGCSGEDDIVKIIQHPPAQDQMSQYGGQGSMDNIPEGEGEKPSGPAALPLGFSYYSLAMSDLYSALRENLGAKGDARIANASGSARELPTSSVLGEMPSQGSLKQTKDPRSQSQPVLQP